MTSFEKIIVAAFLAIGLNACSSKEKQKETNTSPAKTESAAVAAAPVADANKKATDSKTAKTKKAAAASTESTADTAGASAGTITCKSGSDTRIIENKDSGAGCEVIYTKNDQPTSIATANNDKSYCAAVVTKVKNNLTAAGFNCQ